MRARVGLGLFVIGFAACLFPSVDNLGGAQDASLDSPADSSADVKSTDADAGAIDAKADSDASSTVHFCATQLDAAFCADFDETGDVAAGFSSVYLTDGGVIALDDAASTSPPTSLLAGDDALAASGNAHACVVANTGLTPTSSLVLDVDIRVDQLASQGTYIEAFAIVLESPTQSSIQLNLKSASSEVGEEIDTDAGKLYIPHVFLAPVTTAKWSHVNISLALNAPRTITVTVDTTIVVDHAPMSASFVIGSADLYAGNAYAPGPSSGARIHYDNVVLHLD